jgi:hypothetical protein
MPFKVSRKEEITEEELEKFRQYEEDHDWLSDHAQEVEEKYKGKFIAVVNKQLFVGESWEEAFAKAKQTFPERYPIVEYIPWKRRIMVL